MAALYVAASGPGVSLPAGGHWDKVLHAAAYALLAGLIGWAAARGRLRAVTGRTLIVAWLVSTGYGATDELHQSFVPGRQADAADLAADSLGALAAAGVIRAWGIISRGSG